MAHPKVSVLHSKKFGTWRVKVGGMVVATYTGKMAAEHHAKSVRKALRAK
jgi:hypothetical protein